MKIIKVLFVFLVCLVMPVIAMDAPEEKINLAPQNNQKIKPIVGSLKQICTLSIAEKLKDQLNNQEIINIQEYNLPQELLCCLGSTLLSLHSKAKQKIKTTIYAGIPIESVTLTGYTNSVYSVAFSPDGKTLASGSDDKTVRLWDLGALKELTTFKADQVNSVAFNPNGKVLASGSWDKIIRMWNLETWQELSPLDGHTGYVSSIAYHPNGTQLASGSWDYTCKIWDLKSQQEVCTLNNHRYVTSVAYHPDGRLLASSIVPSSYNDKVISIWNLKDRNQISTFNSAKGLHCTSTVVFSPNGVLLVASSNNTNKLYDLQFQKKLATFNCFSVSNSPVFNPDGKLLASISHNATINLWDLETLKELTTLKGHTYSFTSVAFSPNGKLLASGSYDKTVRIWDLRKLNAALHVLNNEVSLQEATAAVQWAKKDNNSKMPIKKLQNLMKKE